MHARQTETYECFCGIPDRRLGCPSTIRFRWSTTTFLTGQLFQKTPGRLVPDGWVGPKSSGCRCHFRAFQLKLFILDIQNFGNGPVVKKLQLFENAKFSKNHHFFLSDSPSTLGPTVVHVVISTGS